MHSLGARQLPLLSASPGAAEENVGRLPTDTVGVACPESPHLCSAVLLSDTLGRAGAERLSPTSQGLYPIPPLER